MRAWRDEVRLAAEARYSGGRQLNYRFAGSAALDKAAAEVLLRLRDAAVLRWADSAFASQAERDQFFKLHRENQGGTGDMGPYQRQARELAQIAADPRWSITKSTEWQSLAEPGGNEIGRFQMWPHPDGSAEIRLNYKGPSGGGSTTLKVPAVTQDDVGQAVRQTREEIESAELDLKMAAAADGLPFFSGEMGMSAAVGASGRAVQAQARIKALNQRLTALGTKEGERLLMRERLVKAIKDSPLKDQIGEKLSEDYLRGLVGAYTGMRVAWHDLSGDKEGYEEWRAHLENLRHYFPGSTGSRFRGGWEGFLSDSVETAGAATPQALMMLGTGGYSALAGPVGTSLLLGRTVAGLQASMAAAGSYGQSVAQADQTAAQLRELARSFEIEFPEEAARLRAEADAIAKNRRWTAGGKALATAMIDRILPEELMPLKPGAGGFLQRQATAHGRNLLESAAETSFGQVYDHAAYGTLIDPEQGLRDIATGVFGQGPLVTAGAARGRQTQNQPSMEPVEASVTSSGSSARKPPATNRPSFLRLATDLNTHTLKQDEIGKKIDHPADENRDPGRTLARIRGGASGGGSAGSSQAARATDASQPDSPIPGLQQLDQETFRAGVESVRHANGAEHDVFFDPATERVVKLTNPGGIRC